MKQRNVAGILLELRNCTTKATNCIAEKMCKLLQLDRKMLRQLVDESMKKNMPDTRFDYQTSAILESESVFYQAFNDFQCEKSL